MPLLENVEVVLGKHRPRADAVQNKEALLFMKQKSEAVVIQ